jgi:hypothetical protein
MQSPIIDLLVKVAEQLSMDEQKELLNRLEGLIATSVRDITNLSCGCVSTALNPAP